MSECVCVCVSVRLRHCLFSSSPTWQPALSLFLSIAKHSLPLSSVFNVSRVIHFFCHALISIKTTSLGNRARRGAPPPPHYLPPCLFSSPSGLTRAVPRVRPGNCDDALIIVAPPPVRPFHRWRGSPACRAAPFAHLLISQGDAPLITPSHYCLFPNQSGGGGGGREGRMNWVWE